MKEDVNRERDTMNSEYDGRRKKGIGTLTAMVLIPVRSVTVALPPRTSIELTMMLVASLDIKELRKYSRNGDSICYKKTYPKNMKIRCAGFPQRAPTTSSQVCA
jgi:hypothetical protein